MRTVLVLLTFFSAHVFASGDVASDPSLDYTFFVLGMRMADTEQIGDAFEQRCGNFYAESHSEIRAASVCADAVEEIIKPSGGEMVSKRETNGNRLVLLSGVGYKRINEAYSIITMGAGKNLNFSKCTTVQRLSFVAGVYARGGSNFQFSTISNWTWPATIQILKDAGCNIVYIHKPNGGSGGGSTVVFQVAPSKLVSNYLQRVDGWKPKDRRWD